MRRVRSLDLQQIFKTVAVKIAVVLMACSMVGAIPGMTSAQEMPLEDISPVEIPELERGPMVEPEQGVVDPDMPDQGTPVFLRAREAVGALMREYIFGDWITFEDQVAEDFPQRMAFLFETQTAGMQRIPNDFQFFISTVNESKEVLSVTFSWIKKHMNWDDPNDTKAEGKCEFVFQKTSQGLLLKNVIGDYPF